MRRQNTIDAYSRPRDCPEHKKKEITERIIDMITLDCRPVRSVEGKVFYGLLEYLEPGYKIPSRKYFTQAIGSQHQAGKEKLAALVSEAQRIALTTDIWTSSATEAYITVTCHFILSWEIFSFVLSTCAFPERHTGFAISEKLLDIADSYNIRDKISIVVHDLAAKMELCLSILEKEGWSSLHCSAHCLQLCFKAGFEMRAISNLPAASRKLVGHFKHSVVATQGLLQKCTQMNQPYLKVVQEVSTRSNSSYYMLQRLIKLRWPITAALSDESITKRSDRYLDLKPEQWILAQDLVDILGPFEVATTYFGSENNVSVSAILPILYGLIDSIKPQQNDGAAIKQFKREVEIQIKERWDLDCNDSPLFSSLTAATLLDPRFKDLKFLDVSQKERAELEMIDKVKQCVCTAENTNSGTEDQVDHSQEEECPHKKRALDVLLGPEESVTVSPEADDPLVWWKGHCETFPRVSLLATQYLSIPATSTSSERTFSKAGLTVSKLRSSLKPKNVDALNKNWARL